MYVCLCNGYRESDLREMADQGVGCAREAYRRLGNGPNCGRCLDCAQEIIDGAKEGPAMPFLLAGAAATGR